MGCVDEVRRVTQMTLGQKRRLFGKLLPRLLDKAQELYPNGVAPNEIVRSASVAIANAKKGTGIRKSLHLIGLAIDLLLYKDLDHDGEIDDYLVDTESHRELGEWWEKQHELCRWGGRWGDGNHYSLEHEGVR